MLLGQNVVIDNRAGANYIIGTEIVARSAPDGYTLLTTAGAHTINPAVYSKLPYDALRDFTPISHIANSGGLVIVVHPSFPAHSLQELIDMARASPGKIVYGSAGFGNLTHIAGEMFQVMAGVKLNHVPYKSAGPAVNDLLGGQIPLMFGPSPVVVPMVQAGTAAAARIHRPQALDAAARASHRGRTRNQRLRGDGLVRHLRSARHAQGHRGPAERRRAPARADAGHARALRSR